MGGVVKLRIKGYIFTVIMRRHYTGAEKKGGRTAWEEYNLSSLHCAPYRILGSFLPVLLTAAILPRDLESPSISKRQHLVGPAPGEPIFPVR